MPPAFPFPQPQAPAKAERIHPDYRCCEPGDACLLCQPEPRAFGWCGCTEALPCHEHERRTK